MTNRDVNTRCARSVPFPMPCERRFVGLCLVENLHTCQVAVLTLLIDCHWTSMSLPAKHAIIQGTWFVQASVENEGGDADDEVALMPEEAASMVHGVPPTAAR